MRKYIRHIAVALIFTTFVGTGLTFSPRPVHAQKSTSFCYNLPPEAQAACLLGSVATQAVPAVAKAVGGTLLNISLEPLASFIAATLLTLTSWITMLGGLVLNFAVNYTVVNMAQHFSTSGGGIGNAINSTWTAIRDLVNMSFIFILLYTAIMTMFGRADYKKAIVNMVVAAILINFSLFFTKVIIDAANLLTMLFYNAAAPGALVASGSDATMWQTGLSNSITQILGISTIFKLSGPLSAGSLLTTGVMGSVVLLICGFIFFAVALMFIIRYVVLVLVLILSPIMFLGLILPELGSYTKQWWNALSSQAFFAPIFMLLMWVSITVLQGMNFTVDFGKSLNAAGNTASVVNGVSTVQVGPTMASTFINFAIVIVFVIASLLIAKQYSDKAGPLVASMNKWATNTAGKATFGLAARFGRKTVGRVGQAVADNQFLREHEPESRMARLALAAGKKTGSASFDARGTILGDQLGAGAAAGKGGYKQSREDLIKGRMEQAKDLQDVVTGDRVEEAMSQQGYDKETNRRLNRSAAEVEAVRRQVQAKLVTEAKNTTLERQERFIHDISQTRARTPNAYTGVSEDNEAARRLREEQDSQMRSRVRLQAVQQQVLNGHASAIAGGTTDDLEKALSRASDKEVEAIVEANKNLLASEAFAASISVKQLEALMKSEKLEESEKQQLKDARFKPITDGLAAAAIVSPRTVQETAAFEALPGLVKNLKDGELEMMDPANLTNTNFVSQMKPPQIESVMKSTKFTSRQRKSLGDTRNEPLLNTLNSATPDASLIRRVVTKQFNVKDLAGLMSKEVTNPANPTGAVIPLLTHPEVMRNLNPNMLKHMAQEMTPEDVDTMRKALLSVGPNSTATATTIAWLTNPLRGVIDFPEI